jgi:ribonuclease P protein component
VLAQRHRLTGAQDFSSTVRGGSRKGSATLVGHLRAPAVATEATPPPRVGFVVSRAVGNAVVRNRTKRRLRHLVSARLTELPDGCTLVVRALPAAGDADSARLGEDLDRVLRRLTGADRDPGGRS